MLLQRLGIWLVTVALLVGCTRDPLVLYLPNATLEEQTAAQLSVASLNVYARPERRITFVQTAGSKTYELSFVARIPTKTGNALGRECTDVGEDCPRARTIRAVRGMDTGLLVHVIMHEIGHAWGLTHLLPRAMMAPGAWSPFFTVIDQARCVSEGECTKVPAAPAAEAEEADGARKVWPRID